MQILKRISFSWDGVWSEWCFFVETPEAIQHFFLFLFLNFPSVFRTRMSFLLESLKVCQRYFYFSLQTRFGLAECIEDYRKLAQRDPSSQPHRLQKPTISVIRVRVVPGSEEIFVRPTGLRGRRVRKHVRQSDGVVL
jgi:hypothetical protein